MEPSLLTSSHLTALSSCTPRRRLPGTEIFSPRLATKSTAFWLPAVPAAAAGFRKKVRLHAQRQRPSKPLAQPIAKSTKGKDDKAGPKGLDEGGNSNLREEDQGSGESQERSQKKERRMKGLRHAELNPKETPRIVPAVIVDKVRWTPAVKGGGEHGKTTIKEVLESVSWSVHRGQKVGLIGPNGCGKSTQLLMLMQEIEPGSGRILKFPEDMKIAYMQQEADLDNSRTAFEELCAAFNMRRLADIDADIEACASAEDYSDEEMAKYIEERTDTEEGLEKAETMVSELGLDAFRDTLVPELSGGWQMRVALGKIILSKPDIILLDEPTNHVDLETVEFMEDLLQKQDAAMVVVSHDRYFLNQVCNRIVEMSDGTCKTYLGNYVAYLQARDDAFALEWKRYNLHRDRVKALKKRIKRLEERFLLDVLAQKKQDLEKLLATAPPKPQVKVVKNFRFPCCLPTTDDEDENLWEDQAELPILLKVQNLGVRFADHVVLEKISFLLRQGEKVAIVGRNGCGKSTLVRALVKDLDTSAAVDGDAAITSAGAAYFPQRLAEAFNSDDGTVKDALYMSCKPDDINRAGGIDAVLDRLRLDGVTQEQPVSSLSGGEKARVAFAQFLLNPVALLVLDEPTNHLDIPTRELLEDALKAFRGAALVVSHDRFFLREFATRVLEISDGMLKDYDSWDAYEAAAPPQWKSAQDAEVDFIKQDAVVKKVWSGKKMSRLQKREGKAIGLRRLSSRTEEFMEPDRRSSLHTTP
ncbi:unnamed protein product [Durusdinium trenchii]